MFFKNFNIILQYMFIPHDATMFLKGVVKLAWARAPTFFPEGYPFPLS